MNFHWRRAVCSCLVLLGAVIGCRPSQPKTPGDGATYLECRLEPRFVSCQGDLAELSTQKGVSASSGISDLLSRKGKSKHAKRLRLSVSDDAQAIALVGLLMSAEQAGLEQVEVALGEGEYLEIVLPNSERSPPLQMADLYLILDGDRSLAFPTFEQFAAEEGEGSFSPNQAQQALGALCKNAVECRHAVVSLSGTARMPPLVRALWELHRAGGDQASVRLALRDGSSGSGAQGSERRPIADSAIRERLQKQEQEFRHCLRLGPDEEANARGTVTLTFTITRPGIVFEATLDPQRSTIVEPEVVHCIVERVTKTQFPKPEGLELTVDHTFRF